MIFHVLTAVTRVDNLPRLGASLAVMAPEAHWHLGFDRLHQHVGGQAVKNRLLDGIHDGWVWVLDDDTLAHPSLYRRIAEVLRDQPETQAVVVSQERRNGVILHASSDQVRTGYVDIGQAVLRRDLIGDARLPECYEGDGRFLERVLADRTDVVYLDEVLSFHNALEAIPA